MDVIEICDNLRDLLPFAQFEKHNNQLRRYKTLFHVCFSLFPNNRNGSILAKVSHMFAFSLSLCFHLQQV